MEVFEASKVTFNLSRMPTFTLSSRSVVNDALADYKISADEYQAVFDASEAANISNISQLLLALEDGIILENGRGGCECLGRARHHL
jgi:hypothetical protein